MRISLRIRTDDTRIKELGTFNLDPGDTITVTDGNGEERIWLDREHTWWSGFKWRILARLLRKHQG